MITITPSKSFRQKASKAILSIVFFIFAYFVLIALAVGITIACGYAAIAIITAKASLFTLLAGLGVFSVGLLILYFLIKFVFSTNKTDRSNYIELSCNEEPRLFAFVEDIAEKAGTDFPKKIYLSPDVNAAVFYDSSFWSMFLPVRKNLLLGVGLMNSVTVDEFRGIVAHEFGHFSQRSMKVGSYVYNVNRIIYNMLYENDSYGTMVSRLASIHVIFSITTFIGVKVINGIQWTLQHVYEIVNTCYMALSREMEFHADEIAANIAGSDALATSLVRMDLASASYSHVLNFYSGKIEDNAKPMDIFPQMRFVMEHSAKEYQFEFTNSLPVLTLASQSRFNKSKLSFEDQWASHPSVEDRVARLQELAIMTATKDSSLASTLFIAPEKVQERISGLLFSTVTYNGPVTVHTPDDFRREFLENHSKGSFPRKFNYYYDNLALSNIDFDTLPETTTFTEEELFSMQAVDRVYDSIGLYNDLETLNGLAAAAKGPKSFDYDGRRFRSKDASLLISEVKQEYEKTKSAIEANDREIYTYYHILAKRSGKAAEYKVKYHVYKKYEDNIDKALSPVSALYDATQFMRYTHSHEDIQRSMSKVYDKEQNFKTAIWELLDNSPASLTEGAKDILQRYVNSKMVYFLGETYDNAALDLMFTSLETYNTLINNELFRLKKDFLDFQAALVPETANITQA